MISNPIPDDVIASGGTVTIDAPVDSLTVAGGTVRVDAPVAGDIIATGGTLTINDDVGGKVIAAGGEIEVNGNATNLLITGGTVRIGENAVIQRAAFISAGKVTHAGSVQRNLTVSAGNRIVEKEPQSPLSAILPVLAAVGFLDPRAHPRQGLSPSAQTRWPARSSEARSSSRSPGSSRSSYQ